MENDFDLNRRDFVKTAGVLTGAVALGMPLFAEGQLSGSIDTVPLELTVNGVRQNLSLDPRITLLDLLREYLQLTGTKKGCDHGQCGACTVLANGRRINSCLSLAVTHDGDEITTIEGLAQGEQLHPVQAAFLEHDGFQCGYCTPGQMMSAAALLKEPCGADNDSVRECMSGNICRCGAYPGIVEAVQSAYRQSQRITELGGGK